jgi:hypothetical protein
VLHDRSILAHIPCGLGLLFIQLKALRYWYYGSGTMTLALDTQLDLLATKDPPLKILQLSCWH